MRVFAHFDITILTKASLNKMNDCSCALAQTAAQLSLSWMTRYCVVRNVSLSSVLPACSFFLHIHIHTGVYVVSAVVKVTEWMVSKDNAWGPTLCHHEGDTGQGYKGNCVL